MRTPLPRSDISRPFFPEYLRIGRSGLRRMDDDLTDRVWKGDPLLGWGGDDRLCVYVAPAAQKWCLVRFCEDNEYRTLTTAPATPGNAVNVVGRFIGFLLAHDSRRGVDLVAEVTKAEDKAQATVSANLDAWCEENGPRLANRLLDA